MGEILRKPGQPGFGVPEKPGYVRVPGEVLNPTLSYHRTLMRVAGVEAVEAYFLRSDGTGVNYGMAYTKSNQDFATYATPWEKQFSNLARHVGADPVLDDDLRVIGHYGWFNGKQIHIPRGVLDSRGTAASFSLNDLLNERIPIIVNNIVDNESTYATESWTTTEQKYELITDVNGVVLLNTGYDLVGLQSAEGALLVIGLVYGAANLIANTGIAGIRSLVRRFVSKESRGLNGAEMAMRIRRGGKRVVANLGGVGEEEGAINLNPNLVAPRKGIPNLVQRPAEEIGDVFDPNSIDDIVSNRLPPNTIDWKKVLPGARKVLKPGGSITISFQGIGEDAAVILDQLKKLGFQKIEDVLGKGAVVKAIR